MHNAQGRRGRSNENTFGATAYSVFSHTASPLNMILVDFYGILIPSTAAIMILPTVDFYGVIIPSTAAVHWSCLAGAAGSTQLTFTLRPPTLSRATSTLPISGGSAASSAVVSCTATGPPPGRKEGQYFREERHGF